MKSHRREVKPHQDPLRKAAREPGKQVLRVDLNKLKMDELYSVFGFEFSP